MLATEQETIEELINKKYDTKEIDSKMLKLLKILVEDEMKTINMSKVDSALAEEQQAAAEAVEAAGNNDDVEAALTCE